MNADTAAAIATVVLIVAGLLVYVIFQVFGFVRFLKSLPVAIQQVCDANALMYTLQDKLLQLNVVSQSEIQSLAGFCVDHWRLMGRKGILDRQSRLAAALATNYFADSPSIEAVAANAAQIARCATEVLDAADADSLFASDPTSHSR